MKSLFLLIWLGMVSQSLPAQDTFARIRSTRDVSATLSRLYDVLQQKNLRVFATIDHSRGAARAGLELRPTVLVIFGNPEVGTRLMHCDQRTGLDLPLKMLVWEDDRGTVWIGYRQPAGWARGYHLDDCNEIILSTGQALQGIAEAAAN